VTAEIAAAVAIQPQKDGVARKFSQDELRKRSAGLVVSVVILVSSGCSGSSSAASAPQLPPLNVKVARVEKKDVPIFREWIGKLDGMVNAEINAKVTGYLLTRNYSEGSYVKKGQLLFEIDPRPYQAALDQSKRQVSEASGKLAPARAQLVRLRHS
jgi:membrane fusion protein (multidrug efflux system)